MNPYQLALNDAGLTRLTTDDAGSILWLALAISAAGYSSGFTGGNPWRYIQKTWRDAGFTESYVGRVITPRLESYATRYDAR
jgi:hypothetical protein